MIRLRPNILFTAWFGLIYFWAYLKRGQRGFWRTLMFGVRNYRHVLTRE